MSDSPIQQRGSAVLVYFAASFMLHLIWENAQMPLFDAPGISLRDSFTGRNIRPV